MKRKETQKGLCLVNMVYALVILGILAAIAIPQFAKFRVKAQNKAALSDVRNMATELYSYCEEYQVYPY